MNYHETEHFIMQKPEASQDYPFGEDVKVFKIKAKMFALLGYHEGIARVNLKCDPLEAEGLREIFHAVIPGYHMNKKHWNTVILDGSVPVGELKRMIDNSYSLVVKGLCKPDREALERLYTQEMLYR